MSGRENEQITRSGNEKEVLKGILHELRSYLDYDIVLLDMVTTIV